MCRLRIRVRSLLSVECGDFTVSVKDFVSDAGSSAELVSESAEIS